MKGVQSLLTYKVRPVANGWGNEEGTPGLPTLFLGWELWPAKGGFPESPVPNQPLRSSAAAPAYHPALWKGKCGKPPPTHTHPTANAHTWNYHLVLLPFCLHPDISLTCSPTPVSGAHLTLTLLQKPDSVVPEAPPSKSVLCRTGPFAPAGEGDWRRDLLCPWRRGKAQRLGRRQCWTWEARTDGEDGP